MLLWESGAVKNFEEPSEYVVRICAPAHMHIHSIFGFTFPQLEIFFFSHIWIASQKECRKKKNKNQSRFFKRSENKKIRTKCASTIRKRGTGLPKEEAVKKMCNSNDAFKWEKNHLLLANTTMIFCQKQCTEKCLQRKMHTITVAKSTMDEFFFSCVCSWH